MATMEQLSALGFHCTGGMIDKDGVNYGTLSADGPVLTPEGEDLVKGMTRKTKKARDEDISAAVQAAAKDVVEGSPGAA